MTIPGHFLLTAMLSDLCGCSPVVTVGFALSATYPDVAALPESLREDWSTYNELHFHTPWLWLYPPTALHLLLDRWMHKPEGEWYWWAYGVEAVFDLACVAYFLGRFGWL